MTRKKTNDFDQGLLDLYDRYVHGFIDRRQFLDRASAFAVGGMSASALLESLSPKYDELQQVRSDDAQVSGEYVEYASPQGAGTMRGYLVRPAGSEGDLPGVVVGLGEDLVQRANFGHRQVRVHCADRRPDCLQQISGRGPARSDREAHGPPNQ